MADKDRHAAAFQSASPFRHVVLDDFFAQTFVRRIVEDFPAFDTETAINEAGTVGSKSTQEGVAGLGDAYAELDQLVQSPAFLDLIGTITGIPDLCYDPHYFGGGTHENREGQDLDPHIDFNLHPITRQHRRLNLIVYLNAQWEDAWGGSLQLHRDPYQPPEDDEIVTLTPLLNRCVIFETTEASWHGFERIALPQDKRHLSRKSFALYYYTDSRPPEEVGPHHSTIYVDRHPPASIQPNTILSEADFNEMRRLIMRRDHHNRHLYNLTARMQGELDQMQSRLRAAEGLSAELETQRQRIKHLETRQVEPGEEGAQQADTVRQMNALLEINVEMDKRLDEAKAQLAEVYRSRSWLLTRPLRSAGWAVRRLMGRG